MKHNRNCKWNLVRNMLIMQQVECLKCAIHAIFKGFVMFWRMADNYMQLNSKYCLIIIYGDTKRKKEGNNMIITLPLDCFKVICC